jgi:serine phosphatase RsbU (regulator of sigma subunit)
MQIKSCRFIILFLFLFPFFVQGQEDTTTPLQKKYYKYYRMGNGNRQIKKYNKSYSYFKQAFKTFDLLKDTSNLKVTYAKLNTSFANLASELGDVNNYDLELDSAFYYYREAQKSYVIAHKQDAAFDLTQKMAQIALSSVEGHNSYQKAIEQYEGLLNQEALIKPEIIANTYYQIARVYELMGALDTALMVLHSDTFENRIIQESNQNKILIYQKIAKFHIENYRNNGLNKASLDFAIGFFKSTIEESDDKLLNANNHLLKAEFELLLGRRVRYLEDYSRAIALFQEEDDHEQIVLICMKVSKELLAAEEYLRANTYLNEGRKHVDFLEEEDKLSYLLEFDALSDDLERETKLHTSERTSSLDEQLAEQRWWYRTFAIMGLVVILLIMAWSYYQKRKSNTLLLHQNDEIKQQKEEISSQRDNIEKQKNLLKTAIQNIQVLNEIGQSITATLDQNILVDTIYDCATSLAPVEKFALGLYVEKKHEINFLEFRTIDKKLPKHSVSLSNAKSLITNSILLKDPIVIDDFENEEVYEDYPYQHPLTQGEKAPNSILYLPLMIQQKIVGIMSLQSSEKDAYTKEHLGSLQILATYVSVALDNASAYQTIEKKNKHITDSIRYGETIQKALLPNLMKEKGLFQDSFVLFRPKDLVSGDFYWFTEIDNKTFVAAVDCTGHGVPGAFMSMIGNTLLNEIVNQNRNFDPARVLEALHIEIRLALHQSQEAGKANDDGMDIGLLKIEKSNQEDTFELTFAGAKRHLWYIEPSYQELKRIKGDRKSIGGVQKEQHRNFTNTKLEVAKDTVIYLSTDGLVDQGNPERKKFGTTRLSNLLLQNAKLSLVEQMQLIESDLDEFQQDAEQRDDITLIGLKV